MKPEGILEGVTLAPVGLFFASEAILVGGHIERFDGHELLQHRPSSDHSRGRLTR